MRDKIMQISDSIVMSVEPYEKCTVINQIDQAIFESEQEIANGAKARTAVDVFKELEKKYYR